MSESASRGATTRGDASVAELVKQLSEQTSALARQEVRLAQLELQEKGKRAGLGIGMFGAAGLVALFGLAALIAAAALGLANVMPGWAAALIVGAVLLVIAGVAALAGRSQVSRATPPVPEAAKESVKEDIDVIKERARR